MAGEPRSGRSHASTPSSTTTSKITRPHVSIRDGVTEGIAWPQNQFSAATSTSSPHDVIVLRGIEPNFGWKRFCHAVVEVAARDPFELVVTLGALLADVPHTRTPTITGTATDPELIARLGLERSRYEGPTGIVGVLHDACREAGLVSASLWAPVPHYVASAPDPMASRELVSCFPPCSRASTSISPSSTSPAEGWRHQSARRSATGTTSGLRRRAGEPLRHRGSRRHAGCPPSGEDLAAELERYLHEQHPDDEN